MESNGFTGQLTSGDKSVRGKICYLPTQWIWWVVLPLRWAISRGAGLVFGENVQRILWNKVLTPANFLTGLRIWLLVKAVMMFFDGTSLARQTEILFIAIITDFFDGPLARNNNEVTELGTYMDHSGDWAVVVWVVFLTFWYGTLPLTWLLAIFAIMPVLLFIYIAKFKKFYDPEASWLENAGAFAAEELQTDFWGRIQFFFLCITLFAALFIASAENPEFFFYQLTNSVPSGAQSLIVNASLALYLYFGGYSTRDALNYSEAQVKKFREKLSKLKNGS